MNSKSILIVAGEPNSIFLEIFFKSIKSKKFKNPLILITSENFKKTNEKLNFKKKIKILDRNKFYNQKLNNKSINLININFDQKKYLKNFKKIK